METREFRATGHQLVDLLADYLETVEAKPLFSSIEPRALAALFDEPLPQEPSTIAAIIEELQAKVLPHCTQINHPGYLGLITPTPTPVGILGDFIASTLNQNASVWSCGPSATTVERQVLRWLTDLVGYGPQAGGNLTSGGSMATFIGLKLARDWATGDRAQHEGITGPLSAYTSEERHVSVDKSADAIGIGRNGLRIIPTDDQFRIRVDLLAQAIAADRQRGVQPIAVVATGGSTNTGVIDPLDELRALCDRERLWLHVDAAYGGGMLLSRRHPGALAGLAYADSVTIDPHKWFFAPLDAGAVLVRDAERLTRSYGLQPRYLIDGAADGGERYNFYVHGFEQSRRFRALKVWMGMKRYGAAQIGAWVDANIDHVLRLYEHFSADPDFAVARRPVMSVICARYRGAGDLSDAQSARLHATVARRIEEGGQFWIGTTYLKGQWYFRVCPVNFRTRTEHIDRLYQLLKDECAAAAADAR